MPTTDPLPYAVLEQVWEQMLLRYGHQFLARWDGMDIGAVKEDWRYQLAGLNGAQLSYGCRDYPPGPPPDVVQFRAFCRQMPVAGTRPKLPPPGPKPVPASIRQALAKLAEPVEPGVPEKIRWARRYVARWAKEAHLSPTQRSALAHAKRILERHAAAEAFEANKAAAQQAADAHAQAEGIGQ
jgi:hypothetical protein